MVTYQDDVMFRNIPYMYIAYIVLSVSSCTANGILIWIILRKRELRTISNVIVVSLAVCDFFIGLIISPMEMIHHLLPEFNIVGYGCLTHQVVQMFIPLASIVHLLLIAVERFIKIVYPLHYHLIATKSRTKVLLLMVWVFPLSVCSIPLAGAYQNMVKENFTGHPCANLDMLPCWYLYSVLMLIASICIFMTIIYTIIMKIAYHHAKQLRQLTVSSQRLKLGRTSELKALTVLVVTVMYFILSWTPFSINIIDECVSMRPTTYYTPAVFIAYFNSSINPIIYGIGKKELRESLVDLCCRRKKIKIRTVLSVVSTNEQKPKPTESNF